MARDIKAVELLEMLIEWAKEFRANRDWFTRNSHMHHIIDETPSQEVVDAVLVGFINTFGGSQWSIDVGLCASDLEVAMTQKERDELRKLQDRFIAKCQREDRRYKNDLTVAIHGIGPDMTIGQLKNELHPELKGIFESYLVKP